MKFLNVLPILAAGPALASYSRGIFRRDDTCDITLATSSGNRKIAIVIDSSGSMYDNDPNNVRIGAGKGLNKQLVSGSDKVAVIDFDYSATILYPLGDPAGAESSFDQIDSVGGTDIAAGVQAAIDEITSGGGDTAGRSGIVVLTDGESDVSPLIDQINNAASLGIRVAFGFLAPSVSFYQPELLSAILKTGGSYTSFQSADAIQSFLFLVLSNGLVDNDVSSSTEQAILPGITVAKLSGGAASSITFGYEAKDGEELQFTIESLSNQELSADLQDASGSSVGSNTTASGPATIDYSGGAGELKLVVSASNDTAEGVFQVSLNSSLGIANCNLNTTTPTGNTTNPPGNATITPTGTPTPTNVVVGAAGRFAEVGLAAVGIAAAAMFL